MKYILFTTLLFIAILGNAFSNEIKGSLESINGEALALSHVKISRYDNDSTLFFKELKNSKAFSVSVDYSGIVQCSFVGVNHKSIALPINLSDFDDTITLDVKLAKYKRADVMKSASVLLDYKGFSPREALVLKEQADGTFTADIAMKNDSLAYKFYRAVDGNMAIAGNLADEFAYQEDIGFYNIKRSTAETVKIVFDPSIFEKKNQSSTINSSSKKLSKFINSFQEIAQQRSEIIARFQLYSKSSNTKLLSDDLKKTLKKLTFVFEKKEGFEKEIVGMDYLNVAGMGIFSGNTDAIDKTMIRKIIATIPAKSGLWSNWALGTGIPVSINNFISSSDHPYFDSVMHHHPNPSVREGMMYESLVYAYMSGDKKLVRKYYELLFIYFPESPKVKQGKQLLAKIKSSKTGQAIADFSVPSLDKPGEMISTKHFRGKFLLIDFWATWCGPCVRELPTLHKVYEKFKSDKFEILSLSLDRNKVKIEQFRAKKWKMPWLHTFLQGGFNHSICRKFKVKSIPRPILIGPDGKIIAEGGALRGMYLERTLEKYLGEK